VVEYELLGLYQDVEQAADVIDALRGVGLSERWIQVLSAFPISPKVLGRKHPHHTMGLVAAAGALAGLMAALFFTVVTPQLYPIVVGGRPLVNAPPMLIVVFELVMLGTLVGAFLGFLWQGGFPAMGGLYDERIAAGHVGVLARVNGDLLEKTEQAYQNDGLVDLLKQEITPPRWNPRLWIGGLVLAGAVVVNLLLLGVTYDVIHLGFLPDQMKEQVSFAPQMGPRIEAPEGIVPVQGLAVIGGRPATAPLAVTDDSLQRGEVLYSLHCALCHGPRDEEAVTAVAERFRDSGLAVQPPFMAGSRVQSLDAESIFVAISNGWGTMPSLAENLYPAERWDVVNYVQAASE
jgi:mono/diheme cytochrome c family protein